MSTIGCPSLSSECAPTVKKSLIESPPEIEDFEVYLLHFDDSDTLIFFLDGSLYISFNAGESWEAVEAFKGRKSRYPAEFAYMDPFHKGRAFVSENGRVHVTEDQGRNWKQLPVPTPNEHIECRRVQTHPTDRRLILVYINIQHGRQFIYASDDAGKSFRVIAPPSEYDEVDHSNECHRCYFPVPSNEATSDNKGIYYIYESQYEKLSATQDTVKSQERAYLQRVYQERALFEVATLFYTPDLGKTVKTFDELDGLRVTGVFVCPSNVFVMTWEWEWPPVTKLWVSKGGSFELVRLPNGVGSLIYVHRLPGDYQKRLLLAVKENDGERNLLIMDSSTLNFSRIPFKSQNSDFKQLGNLKGTLWGNLSIKSENSEESASKTSTTVTKVSFDNGKSWTNLRVVDPSGKHRHLFEGDIDDVEQYSLQASPLDVDRCCCVSNTFDDYSCSKSTAGIVMKIGTVGKRHIWPNNHDMTFISRDGGATWEIAFEFPVDAAFLDFGNIIVAIPRKVTAHSKVYNKFFFSLDQGRTWNEYYFEEPIRGLCCDVHSLGLKALITILRGKEEEEEDFTEYVFYSLDFSNIFGGAACTKNDLERWYLYDGKCLDGVRYSFDRRKPDAKCLVRKTFKELKLHEERCES